MLSSSDGQKANSTKSPQLSKKPWQTEMSTTIAPSPTTYHASGVLSAIGSTPLIELERLLPDAGFRLFAKLEMLNPGGSVKDRAGLKILLDALNEKRINRNTTVVESSSGNMGIALAQACAYLGMRLICVVDPKTTSKNLSILRALGTEIVMVSEPDAETGEYLPVRLREVHRLIASVPNSYWPNQYGNPANARAHYDSTMPEIVQALNGECDYLFCAVSTCGTITGCAEFIRRHSLPIRVIAVDAVGSRIFGHACAKRRIPGHGAAFRPPLCKPELVDRCVEVSDLDCVAGCRRLLRREAILAGGSSGGVVSAVTRLQPEVPPGSTCALILADRGERYLDTIYSDEWVERELGGLPE
jgi:2,3-diaminopropionate biosynthesis protein SbnA